MPKSKNAQGILLMLAASLSFALMAAATKSLSGELPASEVVFIRSILSTLALGFYFFFHETPAWPGKKPALLAARGVIGFVALLLYFWSLPRLHLGTAVMLNYTAPVFAVIASHLVFKEKTHTHMKLLTALSFFGVYLVTVPQLNEKPTALLAALASGFLAGMVHLLIRQSSGEKESPLLIIFYFTVTCALGSALLAPFTIWAWPSLDQWPALILITVFSFLGQMGLTYSLRQAAVPVVSPFGYLTPVIGLVIGFFIWKENPGWAGWLGSAIVIVSGALLYKRQA